MNCYMHNDRPAAAYCRACGRALCEECERRAGGTIWCPEHAPASREEPAWAAGVAQGARVAAEGAAAAARAVRGAGLAAPGAGGGSPALAFILGFLIPGVGAIYNGQYGKGLVHAVIFGLLVSILSSGAAAGLEPLFGILLAVWIFYMGLEAYHTALKRERGEPVDEFSSLLDVRGRSGGQATGALILIAVGVILLLNTMDILRFRYIVRYWPALLIATGVYMLVGRIRGAGGREAADSGAGWHGRPGRAETGQSGAEGAAGPEVSEAADERR